MDSLMNGLMTGANFGTGFIQGQDQQQDRMFRQQQQQLLGSQQSMAMLMNGMKFQDEQKKLGYDQDESTYARQLATDPDTMELPMDQKMDLLAKNALTKGDLVRASEFATNATNFRVAQDTADQKKAAIARGTMESQQKLHQYMGSELAAAAEGGEDEFNKAKLLALSSGHGTPEDQQRLANLKWDPDLARRLRLGAMTSRQQAQTLAEQQRIQETKAREDSLKSARETRLAIQKQRLTDQEATAAAKAKAGGGQKAPTENELNQALPYLKDLKLDPADRAQAQQTLVSMKKAIQKSNPNIPDAQAFQKAAKLLPQDLQEVTIPGVIHALDTKKTTYKMVGATPKDAIPYTGDQSSLIPGRYYRTDSHGVVQFTGTGFIPVQ